MTRRLALSIVLCAAACGHKAPATSTTTADEHGDHAEHGGMNGMEGMEGMEGMKDMDAKLPPALATFHDRMAPLWHADAGANRTDNTCAATGDLTRMAMGIEQAGAPTGADAAVWPGKVADLRTAVAALTDDCTKTKGAAIDAMFPPVHVAFHALMDLLPHAE